MSQTQKEALKALAEKLSRAERTTGRSGAVDKTPKEVMLDASGIQEKNPDKHYRYVNTTDPAKVQRRLRQDYKTVPEAEAEAAGVRATVGELRLMELPREKAEERAAEHKKVHKHRLEAHKTEVLQAAEAVARVLRDEHGINVPVERLLVDEG